MVFVSGIMVGDGWWWSREEGVMEAGFVDGSNNFNGKKILMEVVRV